MDCSFLAQALMPEGRGVISLVGAGGKTTLMFSLARWLSDRGKRVLTTTTTRIFKPATAQSPVLVLSEKPEDLLRRTENLLKTRPHVTAGAGYLPGQNKIRGFSPGTITLLWKSGIADWIIVEADGAAGCPLKAPAPHEPVIPAVTCFLFAVVGLRAVGKPLDEENVFRSSIYSELTNLLPGEAVSASSIATALLLDNGIMKGAPAEADKFAFLNMAGREDLIEHGERIASIIQRNEPGKLRGAFIGSATEHPECWKWRSVQPEISKRLMDDSQ